MYFSDVFSKKEKMTKYRYRKHTVIILTFTHQVDKEIKQCTSFVGLIVQVCF